MGEEARSRTQTASAPTHVAAWLPIPLTLAVTLEAFRVLFPDLYGLKERTDLQTTLMAVAVVVVTPCVTPLLAKTFGRRRSLTGALVLLAVWRATVQLFTSIPTSLAALGVMTALIALTLALSAADDGDAISPATGIVIGLALDLVVMAVFDTWDPVHQRSPIAFAVAAVFAAALTASAVWTHRTSQRNEHSDWSSPSLTAGVAVGAILAIEVLFLANSGYLAAAAGTGAAITALVIGVGLLAALGGAVAATSTGTGAFFGAVGTVAVAGFLLPEATGNVTVAITWACQVAAGVIVGTVFTTRTRHPRRTELGLALGWALALVAMLLFQLHYDEPLPIDNRYVTATLGLITVTAGLRHSIRTEEPARRRWRHAVVAVCACGLLATVTATATATSPGSVSAPPEAIRLIQWNVRQAVDERGRLDPEAIADAVEVADIVVLNEVGRGWPSSGQLDAAEWLARRLDMHMAWGGAASQQFGTLVLSRFPIESSHVLRLPHAGNSQRRSLLVVTIALGKGSSLHVLATHLQHHNDPSSMAVRMEEIDVIIDEWNGNSATVLAGDFNPKQGDPPEYPVRRPGEFDEIAALLGAGFTTMSDLDACRAPTSGSNCSDYVFVSPDLEQTDYRVGEQFGDHRMVVTRIDR
jgi:endonuclease/exonuclease/phosphatase family metal-dependent hydrolase